MLSVTDRKKPSHVTLRPTQSRGKHSYNTYMQCCSMHKSILHQNVKLTRLLYTIFYEHLPRILWVPRFAENRELACHFFSYESVSKDQRLKFMSLPSLPLSFPPARSSSGHDVAVAATDGRGRTRTGPRGQGKEGGPSLYRNPFQQIGVEVSARGRKPRGDLEIVKRELREQEVKFLHKFKSRHTLAWGRHNIQEETSVMAVLFGKNSSLLEMFDRHASQTKILRSVFLLLRYFLRGEKKRSGREGENINDRRAT